MHIEIGKISLVDIVSEDLCIIAQKRVRYYLIPLHGGYIAFSLPSKLDSLFKSNEYSKKAMNELLKEVVNDYFFVAFSEEDIESENIEYVGKMDKKEILEELNVD